MTQIASDTVITKRRSRLGWGLPALGIGALILVIVALAAFPLTGTPATELAPISTPEGVVQRFFMAIYSGDYSAAYGMLSEDARQDLTLSEFQQRLRYERDSEMRIDAVAIHDDTATVTITMTYFSSGGLFGPNEWSNQHDVLLERDGDTWRLMADPFW